MHVHVLIESAVYQFCGNVVIYEDGPKWKSEEDQRTETRRHE